MKPPRIVADPLIADVEREFSRIGKVTLVEGRAISARHLSDTDVLLVRSVTRVNEALLRDTPVQLVCSATAGIDHIDTAYLKRANVHFAYAPGANANAVAEYILSAILEVCRYDDNSFADITLGIVGCGHVGSQVARLFSALGARCLCCDPPRAEQYADRTYAALDDLMDVDVMTLHVPLTDTGMHATRGLFDARRIERLRSGMLLINAARGGVVDETALLERLQYRRDIHTCIDCWAHEPDINRLLVARADLATPHVAGHTRQARLRGTAMIFTAACEHFGISDARDDALVPARRRRLIPAAPGDGGLVVLKDVIRTVYDIRADSRKLKTPLPDGARMGAHFDECRRQRQRAEFNQFDVASRDLDRQGAILLTKAGFTCRHD